MTRRTVIRGADILTMDPALGDLAGADVLVEDGRIAAIGRLPPVQGADLVDATGLVMLPGFVDTHRHTWQTVLRSALPDADVAEYATTVLDGFAPHFRPEDVYAANHLGALAALDAGITTLLDWSHIMNSPDHADEAVRGLADAGIRAVFAHGAPGLGRDDWFGADNTNLHPADIRRVRDTHFSSDDQLLTMAMALRGPELSSMESTEHDLRLGRELGLRISVHVGMGALGPLCRAVERLDAAGLLADDTTYIHCSNLTPNALARLVDTGGTFSISAAVEATLGLGSPPFDRLAALGARPSLSADIETASAGDMFSQLRAAWAVARLAGHARLAGGDDAGLPTVRDLLASATVEGARACGLDGKIGSVTVGKEADLVLLDLSRLNVAPANDPAGAIVQAADTSNVAGVFVAGVPVKLSGRLLDTSATGRALRLGAASRDYLYRAAGLRQAKGALFVAPPRPGTGGHRPPEYAFRRGRGSTSG